MPVAKSAPAQQGPRPTIVRARTSSIVQQRQSLPKVIKVKDDSEVKVERRTDVLASYTSYDFVNMVPNTSTIQIPSMGSDWTSISQEYLEPRSSNEQSTHQQLLRQSLQRLSTPTPQDIHGSISGHLRNFNDHDFSASLDNTFHLEDSSYLATAQPPLYNYSNNSPADQSFGMLEKRGPTSCPTDQFYPQSDLSSSLGSHQQTTFEVEESGPTVGSLEDTYSVSEVFYDDTASALSTSHDPDGYMGSHRSSVTWSTVPEMDYMTVAGLHRDSFSYPAPDYPAPDMTLSVTNEISPRLGFYLEYYEKIICPVTVAIDTPSNPYRRQILSLASDSESLQHAICALASCNLRMKRKQAAAQRVWAQQQAFGRQDPFDVCFHRSEDTQPRNDFMFESPDDGSAMVEEHHHRNTAVALLNAALSSPILARHDSVLATLFVLCHYRMCESGVAQFKTQFAGAKKLMGMRSCGIENSTWGWMETTFTFFDAITATVNDRESQLRGGYLEMIANPQSPEHALENLAGCDGKLFKIIAGLGRLNLLSQQRPVMAQLSSSVPLPSPSPSAPRPRLAGQALVDFYKLHPTRFDGNGFASTLPDEFGVLSSTDHSPTSIDDVFTPPEDLRAQFWREWQSVRQALENWSFSSQSLLSNLPSDSAHVTQAEIRDFNLVSEAFRYAGLLYTERLASPTLPSSGHNFQQYVHQTLSFVQGLSEGSRMEKFLLWPLFVAGSEAVEESHQETVRNVCKGISGRGGYANNVSALDVLEKVWAEGDVGVVNGEGSLTSSPFRWTKHMDPVEGEFIMV